MSSNQHPPLVSRLHYEFDGWLGDDLLTTFPCYIVTQRLADALKASDLSGFEFRDIKVSTSGEFKDFFPKLKLPPFLWLAIDGKAGHEDFGTDAIGDLIVSGNALKLLQTFSLKNCEVSKYCTPET